MRAYKRMSKNATMALFAAGLISTGAVASIGLQAFAQTSSGGATTSTHQRCMDDDDGVALPSGGISKAQATEAIIAQYPNLTIKHIRLENENGAVVYSAKLGDDTEAIVDVMTGAVSLETKEQEVNEHKGMGRWHHMMGPDEANDTEDNNGPDDSTDD